MVAPANAKRSRPKMKNYGIATKNEGLMEWSWVDAQMAKSRNYWIASTRPDGRPHVAPVWGLWIDGTLYFGSDSQSRKARNLAANPNVVVHLESADDTVIIEGTIESFKPDMPLAIRIAEAYGEKYPSFKPEPDTNTPIFRLNPKTVFAWLESSFPNTATRWDFNGA